MKHLLEMATWSESREGGRMALKYPGKWIHFTRRQKNTTSMMTVKPKRTHGDPLGIYFYPTSWVVKQNSRQYAVDFDSYYIVDIAEKANIMDLQTVTLAQIQPLAEAAGWWQRFVDWGVQTSLLSKPQSRIGSLFYLFLIDFDTRPIQRRIIKSLALDGIVDCKGVIHRNEKEQLVMFSKKYLTIIDAGNNKNHENSEGFRTIEAALKQRDFVNASVKWHNRNIRADWTYKNDFACILEGRLPTMHLNILVGAWVYDVRLRSLTETAFLPTVKDLKAKIKKQVVDFCKGYVEHNVAEINDIITEMKVVKKAGLRLSFQYGFCIHISLGADLIIITQPISKIGYIIRSNRHEKKYETSLYEALSAFLALG